MANPRSLRELKNSLGHRVGPLARRIARSQPLTFPQKYDYKATMVLLGVSMTHRWSDNQNQGLITCGSVGFKVSRCSEEVLLVLLVLERCCTIQRFLMNSAPKFRWHYYALLFLLLLLLPLRCKIGSSASSLALGADSIFAAIRAAE